MKREVVIDQPGAALYKQTSGNGNELNYDAKKNVVPDPVALRFGAWVPGYFTKISGDFLTGDESDPRRSERVYLALRTDDHPAAAPGAGCFEFYVTTSPVGSETDAGEVLLARLTKRAGLELFVPLNAYAGIPRNGDGAGGPVDRRTAVANMYRELLLREPDPAGLDGWVNSTLTLDEIRQDIINSDEYRQKHGAPT